MTQQEITPDFVRGLLGIEDGRLYAAAPRIEDAYLQAEEESDHLDKKLTFLQWEHQRKCDNLIKIEARADYLYEENKRLREALEEVLNWFESKSELIGNQIKAKIKKALSPQPTERHECRPVGSDKGDK